MALLQVRKKIEQRAARLAVIGLGYVGLPVAALFADQGFDVVGIDRKAERVAKINSGVSPIEGEEPGLETLVQRAVASGRLRASTEYELLSDRDIVLIDVETPVDENHIPHYEALTSALQNMGPVLQPGALVIVESTIAPGTMRSLVLPILEESTGAKLYEGFYLGNCPERVMPGKLLHNLINLSRVVGGSTPETSEVMVDLYRHIVKADLDPVEWVTAELVKTVENAYRDVQIAFANEVALICEAAGGDVWKVRELVNKSPQRNMHMPGAGVGGHCIPKDPWLLVYGAGNQKMPPQLIIAARSVNNAMPLHIADLIIDELRSAGKHPEESQVLILGYAYLENSDDSRNSPSEALYNQLTAAGYTVRVHDPHVKGYQGDVYELARECDALILMVKHREYQQLDFACLKKILRNPLIVDGRGFWPVELLNELGFQVRTIGRGDSGAWQNP